jgi:ssDNA-binding replication factor A large subunit
MSLYRNREEEGHDVKISTLKPLENNVNVIFKVTKRNNERKVNNRSGETQRVCDFTVSDPTGSITLTLWNKDIDMMKKDSVYKLSNGYANVFKNSLQLSKGKNGTITENDTVFETINEENNRSTERIANPQRDSRRKSGRGNTPRRGGQNRRSSNRLSSDNYEDRPVHRRHNW